MTRTVILVTILFICVMGLTACSDPSMAATAALTILPASSPGPDKSMPAAQVIVSRTISAMSQVRTFQLKIDVKNNSKPLSSSSDASEITQWKGIKLTDISNHELKMDMTINEDLSGTKIDASLEMYLKNGYEYLKTKATGLGLSNLWTKTQCTDDLWNRQSQISYLIELLKTPVQLDLSREEKVNDISYYILNLSPSVQALIDWVISQEQPFGTQVDIMWGGGVPVVRADAYQKGSFRLWINEVNCLPWKVEVTADFQGNVGGGISVDTTTPYSPTNNPVDSVFQGELNFFNYDLPVSIQLPQEAQNKQ